MVEVFISYSRHDAEKVALLARMVEAEGYKVWWDADLPPHQSYGDVITAKIATARAAIVVWSAASVQSEWVRAEADMARNQKKLIQTSLDEVMPPLPFNQIQYAPIGGWLGEPDHSGWRKVKASLAELCGPRQAGAMPPPIAVPVYAPPAPAPAAPPTRWPLYAGLAVGLIGLAAAAGMFLGRGESEVETVEPAPTEAAPAPLATAETVQPAPTQQRIYNLDATVEDPDGYSNVRSGAGTSASIIGRVTVGERFATYQQGGSWWRVRLGDGTEGFISRRLIRLTGEGDSAAIDEPTIDPATLTIPDSSTRLLTAAEIAGFGPATLAQARGEILARRGQRLTDIQRKNIELIRQAEARFGG